jgi:FkbM family methyltransferase
MIRSVTSVRDRLVGFPARRSTSAPTLSRAAKASLEEAELVRRVLAQSGTETGLMVDVGGHFGTVSVLFADAGWEVHAFEPDPNNRFRFRERFDERPSVHLDPRAVGEVDGELLQFYDSPQSSGISGLVNFHETHRPVAEVETVRLETYLRQHRIEGVDFLKIDTEGFDLFVVRSYSWESFPPPAAILCEFEDAKTTRVGYDTTVLANFLIEHGYTLLVSEWHPIERYGVVHSWKTMYPWDSMNRVPSDAWGNLLAFQDPGAAKLAIRMLPGLISLKGDPTRTDRALMSAWKTSARISRKLRSGL